MAFVEIKPIEKAKKIKGKKEKATSNRNLKWLK